MNSTMSYTKSESQCSMDVSKEISNRKSTSAIGSTKFLTFNDDVNGEIIIKCKNDENFIVSMSKLSEYCDYFYIKLDSESSSKYVFVLDYESRTFQILIQIFYGLPNFQTIDQHLKNHKCSIARCLDVLKLANHIRMNKDHIIIDEIEKYIVSVTKSTWIDIIIENCNDPTFENLIDKYLSEYQSGNLADPSYDKMSILKSNEKIYDSIMKSFYDNSMEMKKHHQIFKKEHLDMKNRLSEDKRKEKSLKSKINLLNRILKNRENYLRMSKGWNHWEHIFYREDKLFPVVSEMLNVLN